MPFDPKNLIILAAIIAWFFVPLRKEKWLPFLGLFLFLALAVELSGEWLACTPAGNYLVYNIFILIDFTLTGLILIRITPIPKESKRIAKVSALILLIVAVIFLAGHSPIKEFATSVLLVMGVMLTVHSTVVILRVANTSDTPVLRTPQFWITLSPFFYFACFVPSFGLTMYYTEENQVLAGKLYSINDYLFIIRYFLILIGLYLAHRKEPDA